MPINQRRAYDAALFRATEIERIREERRQQKKEEEERKREKELYSRASTATQRLSQMNLDVFNGLQPEDWEWDTGYIRTKFYKGWIYYYDDKLMYFQKGMGFGGDPFKTWDDLCILVEQHQRQDLWKYYVHEET